MKFRIFNQYIGLNCRLNFRILCVVYIVGLIAGSLLAFCLSGYLTADLIPDILAKPSFVHMLIINLIPAALIIYFAYRSFYVFCYPAIFLRSVFYGFSGVSASFLFGSSSWLIRPLLMFSNNAISVFLWLFLICQSRGLCRNDFYSSLVFILGITFADYFIVSRFLANLSFYF